MKTTIMMTLEEILVQLHSVLCCCWVWRANVATIC